MAKLIVNINEDSREALAKVYEAHSYLSKTDVINLVIQEGVSSLLAGSPPSDAPEEVEETPDEDTESEEETEET